MGQFVGCLLLRVVCVQHQKIGSRVGGWMDGRMGEVWKTGKTRQIRYGISVSRGRCRFESPGVPDPKVSFPSWAVRVSLSLEVLIFLLLS